MKTAIIHDWLIEREEEAPGLDALSKLFPDADIYTLFYRPEALSPAMSTRTIRASRLQNLPGITRFSKYYMPLFPTMIEHIDLRGYDLVISNNRYFAKGVLTQPETCHICLLHPSVLAFWQNTALEPSAASPPFRSVYPFLINYYRIWDVVSSQRVDHFIACAQPMVQHINKYYRRSDISVTDPSDEQNIYDLCCQIMDMFHLKQETAYQTRLRPSELTQPATSPYIED